MTERSASKAARIAALIFAQDENLLDGRSLREITDAMGLGNDRSTILRDLRSLPEARSLRDRLVERLRNLS